MNNDSFNPQPGWSTPVAARFDNSFLSRLIGFFRGSDTCRADKQGKCPGRNLCHDCQWGEGPERGR